MQLPDHFIRYLAQGGPEKTGLAQPERKPIQKPERDGLLRPEKEK
jgi:hypothetical protein